MPPRSIIVGGIVSIAMELDAIPPLCALPK
jgi:hypothetical protein